MNERTDKRQIGSDSEIMDFERLLSAAKSDKNADADPARAILLKQPDEDVVVRRIAPNRKTVKTTVPKLPKKGTKEHIRLCCRFYLSDIVQVDRVHRSLIPLRLSNAKDPRIVSLRRLEFLKDEITNAEDKELADAEAAEGKASGAAPAAAAAAPVRKRRNFAEFEESKRRRITAVIGVDDPVNVKLIEPKDSKIMDQENLSLRVCFPLSFPSFCCRQPIQSNPIQSNPIQSNPIQSNPIQSNPIQSINQSINQSIDHSVVLFWLFCDQVLIWASFCCFVL